MRILSVILTVIILTGCQQFAPRANYQVETCDRTYMWDEVRKRDVITFESCTKSNAQSNREAQNVVLKSNQKTGQLDFTAGELTNAKEAAWAIAIAELMSDPEAVQTGVGLLRALLTGGK